MTTTTTSDRARLQPTDNSLQPDYGVTVEFNVHFARGSAGRREVLPGEPPVNADLPTGSVPRVARLMALAIRCEQLVRRGDVADYADLARLGHVTRARMTQIMNLLNLAPDIQEEILFLPRTTSGRDPIGERDLRPISRVADWRAQRRMWKELLARRTTPATNMHEEASASVERRRTSQTRTRAALATTPG